MTFAVWFLSALFSVLENRVKTKFFILVAALLSLGLAASAQEERDDRWVFVGTGAGMNVGFDGQQFYDRNNSHIGAGLANDSFFGYMFSDWGGVRAGFQGLSISNKFTDFGCKRYEYLHADMLIRAGKSVVPYVHIGIGRIDNFAFGGGAGVIFPLYITKRIAIVPDFKATAYNNRIYAGSKNLPSAVVSATLGLSINLWKNPGKKVKQLQEEVKVQKEVMQEQQKTLKEQKEALKAKDEALKAQEETIMSIKRPEIVRDTVLVTRIQHDTIVVNTITYVPNEIITTLHGDALFDTASDVINPEDYGQLEGVVNWLKENPDVGIIVEGHTDNVGGKDFNLNLSLRRAQSVKTFLVRRGIRPSLITIEGYGYTRPVADNNTEEGRRQNRRVEVRVR